MGGPGRGRTETLTGSEICRQQTWERDRDGDTQTEVAGDGDVKRRDWRARGEEGMLARGGDVGQRRPDAEMR